MQNKTSWISSILKKLVNQKSHFEYFIFEGILMRKKRLSNGLLIDQIVLPDVLAKPLIENLHSMNFFKHLGAIAMERQISYDFYIKNFQSIAVEIIQSCDFCSKNKLYPNKRLDPGMKIHISKPHTFI